ncbi:MAG TPA: TonB-dependent receptor [Phnomibacter sp.]|nr:TonB-dependent receptor [Phnomibacter sp.]
MSFSKIFSTVSFLLLTLTGFSQAKQNNVTISGKVQAADKHPLEGATVTVTSIAKSGNGKADTLRATDVSNKTGEFRLKAAGTAEMYLEISTVGYASYLEPIVLLTGSQSINAGTITLEEEAKSLGNVVVTAKKPMMTLAVDRRIFNADAMITSKGGTAVDLMRNIPGLNVDVNGAVQMRGSSPQILVDGRPTILTLEQIPSDDIEKIEVITNPSSKYDAGSTGGILNIILKKSRRNGMNGTASIGVGTPEILSGNMSFNYRQGKINFFANGNYNQSGGTAVSEANRINKRNFVVTDYFDQSTSTERDRQFASVRFGVDYFFDEENSVSVSQGFVDGDFESKENQDQKYADENGSLTKTGNRYSTDNWGFKRSNTQVNYRRTYSKKTGKEWTADFTFSGGTNGGTNIISNRLFDVNGSPLGNPNLVTNDGSGNGKQYTFQTDYVNPISENSKLEFGARSYHNISNDKLDVYSVANATLTKLPLSNDYGFKEMVNAVYANYSNKLGSKWKYQGGLRIEHSSFKGELKDSGQHFGYEYPKNGKDIWSAIFPSLYLTYTVKEGHDLQFNFSRRIRRPNFWQINPFVDITDPQNIRKGNPGLRPEFTNSMEANYNRVYSKGNFLASVYFRNNKDDITQYTDTVSQEEIEKLNNAAISPNALMTTFINANRTNRFGLELTWQHKFSESFDMTPSINAQYRDVKATVDNVDLNNEGFNWNADFIMNYKIVKPNKKFINDFSFQLQAEYEGPRVIPQGRMKEVYSLDFAIRKDFLKNNAATVTFAINDVLNSRRWGSITDTENFYQDAYRRWNVRNFRFTFSYRFGNKDLQIFKSKESHGEGDEG